MKSLPTPAIVAALAAVIALPFSLAAAGTLMMTAGLGAIIHADYVLGRQRIRLPRLATAVAAPRRNSNSGSPFHREQHQLAA